MILNNEKFDWQEKIKFSVHLPAYFAAVTKDQKDRIGLNRLQREEIGRRCKRIIDQGRCDFVVRKIGLGWCRMIYYVDPKISLENVAIFATCS